MTGPVAFRVSLRTLALATLVALPIFGMGACSGESGTTPDCKVDVTDKGIVPAENGCSGFATCDKGDPAECCKDQMLDPMTHAFCYCLASYGKGSFAECDATMTGGG